MENSIFRQMLDDRLGMFVHFGLYSAMAGYFNGEKISGLGEWIQRNGRIPIKDYSEFGKANFCPREDFAKNLVTKAKEAGVKYIVLTSKHHDGFCLFKSDYSDYSTYGFYGRDICRELADECRKQGLELGLYYSHTLDWHEKNAAGNYYSDNPIRANNRNSWDFPDDNIDFEEYLYGKCFPQVKEILTNYGPLKLIWFDFPHDITKEQSQELRKLVKSLQPDCQINSRIAHDCNDYESLGDNALPVAPLGFNLECLITMNDTWGYRKDDNNWKSPEDCIEILCRTLTSDSTLLLNVGPMADGTLTSETENILEKIGEWVKRNNEAVFGRITGNPLTMTFSWGYISQKENNLYLYVKEKTDKINLIGIPNDIKEISVLGLDEKISYQFDGKALVITQPKCDYSIPVYKIEFNNRPQFSKEIVQYGDEFSLGVLWADKLVRENGKVTRQKLHIERSSYTKDYGTHGLSIDKNVLVCFWDNKNEALCWDVHFEEPGTYEATVIIAKDLDYDEKKQSENRFALYVGDMKNSVDMSKVKKEFSTSKTNLGNMRVCRDAGIFEIKTAGEYKVCLMKENDGENSFVAEVCFGKK